MARISVIIPCYNSGSFLARTIESVLCQDMPDWEMILVDDGSKDSTPQIIRDFCAKDSRIHGVHQENSGRAKACELGARHFSPEAEYLFFLDSDDMLVPGALRVMSAYLDEHPAVGLLGCQLQEVDINDKPIGNMKRSRWVPGWFFPRQLRDEEYETPFVTFFCATGQGPFAMFRKSVFVRTKGWEPALSRFSAQEDTDIFCQMALLAPVHYLPDRLYLKRVHGDSITQQQSRIQQSYECFRQKWDNYKAEDSRQQEILRKAKKHYYSRHRPLRDFKVAWLTLKLMLREPTRDRWKWFIHLCKSGVNGFFIGMRVE